ncbi:MAG: hypothetical protein HFG34_13275 [Eubacterium sp.]|jgi:hypothetical protein|nr:hypothetical protein [Eubacterium sp.]MCI8716835.1 hypothetical protein [Lachnospiraceae bacterium]MCI8826353.1 hypothetical protein [Lachnospiraceae bacterium]
MNKLKQKLSFFLFSIIMVLSITMTPLAWDYSFFEDKTVTAATNYETAHFYTPKGTYYPVVGIKNVTTEGKLIVTFRQRLANGTYGGNVGEIKNVSKYTTGLVFKHTLNANYHKLSITGRETLNIDINYVRLVV